MSTLSITYIDLHHFYIISGANSFTPEDAFVGYQPDTPASVVFKVWQDFNFIDAKLSDNDDQWEEKVHR